MASPTISNQTLNIPKKRPALSQTPSQSIGPSSSKRRKSSFAGPSALRQTSFPPEHQHGSASTPQTPGGSSSIVMRSPSVESSLVAGGARARTTTPSLLGGKGGKTGKKVGRRRKNARVDAAAAVAAGGGDGASSVGHKSGSAGVGAGANGSTVNGDGEGEDGEGEDEDMEEAAGQATLEGGKMTEAALKQEREHMAMLLEAFTPEQSDRYEMWRRVKLRKDSVRRLVNHTLSQSVPASVVTTVSGYTKVMIGELIERARDVQLEWQASAAALPTGEPVSDDAAMSERTRRVDRGPLTPDHLREALRRYKKVHPGRGAGYTGLSLKGVDVAAARMGGRRLF